MIRHASAALAAAALLAAAPAAAQAQSATHEVVTVHGASLEGNLEGNSPDREVYVYLPPSYGEDADRRYPVVYMLHGYGLTAEAWDQFMGFPGPLDQAYADGAREVIVVTPDAYTRQGGSMYSSSAAIGDWESFVAEDLVAYIDGHYRTIPERPSRGLAGHSMGGYGALRLAMKRPDVFSSVYAMSACCLPPQTTPAEGSPQLAQLAALETSATAEPSVGMDFSRVQAASAAAWSPDPDNAPLYFATPTKDGQVQPEVIAAWAANAPITMVHQYVFALKSLDALGMEVGEQDGLIGGNTRLHEIMEGYGIAHDWSTYEGDHTNRLTERFATHALPFFTEHLSFAE